MDHIGYYAAVGLSLSGVALGERCRRDPVTGEPEGLRVATTVALFVGFGMLAYGFIALEWWRPLVAIGVGMFVALFLAGIRTPTLAILIALGCCVAGTLSSAYVLLL